MNKKKEKKILILQFKNKFNFFSKNKQILIKMAFLFKIIFRFLFLICFFESLSCDIYLDTQDLARTLKSLLINQNEGCISLANDLNYQLSDGEIMLNQSSTAIRSTFTFIFKSILLI